LSAAFVEFEPHYTPAGYAATTLTPAVIRERIERQETLVAIVADSIVGTVTMEQRNSAIKVRSMAVLPSVRGHGIARALLIEVETRARERGCLRLELITARFLNAAIRLYESLGFREDLIGPRELFGTPVIPLSKVLSSFR
jgi:GNAT superfamily N-acetyltransferase